MKYRLNSNYTTCCFFLSLCCLLYLGGSGIINAHADSSQGYQTYLFSKKIDLKSDGHISISLNNNVSRYNKESFQDALVSYGSIESLLSNIKSVPLNSPEHTFLRYFSALYNRDYREYGALHSNPDAAYEDLLISVPLEILEKDKEKSIDSKVVMFNALAMSLGPRADDPENLDIQSYLVTKESGYKPDSNNKQHYAIRLRYRVEIDGFVVINYQVLQPIQETKKRFSRSDTRDSLEIRYDEKGFVLDQLSGKSAQNLVSRTGNVVLDASMFLKRSENGQWLILSTDELPDEYEVITKNTWLFIVKNDSFYNPQRKIVKFELSDSESNATKRNMYGVVLIWVRVNLLICTLILSVNTNHYKSLHITNTVDCFLMIDLSGVSKMKITQSKSCQ